MSTDKASHTPGPWCVEDDHGERWIETAHGNDDTIAQVFRRSLKISAVRDKEFQANSNLIAAAPDMLAALKALRLAREQDKYPSWEKGAPKFNEAEAMADAAIAKAEQ